MVPSADHPPPPPPGSIVPAYVSSCSEDYPDTTFTTILRCRSCGTTSSSNNDDNLGLFIIDWAQGDRVCTVCGVVHEENLMEQGPEWREYNCDNGGDHETSAVARSGLVPTDETKYVGGLQPTTLSKTVFGGARTSTSTTSSNSHYSGGGLNLRSRLFQINRRMDRLMERKHHAAYRDAAANLQRKQQLSLSSQHPQDDTTDADTVDGGGGGDRQPNYGTTTTLLAESEMEERVLEQEESQQVRLRALHAEKWSLDRAKSVGATGTDNHDDIVEEHAYLTANLIQASRDLYAAYQIMVAAGEKLHLSVVIVDEAANVLAQYAARRDGLKVKGVTTVSKTSTLWKRGSTTAGTTPDRKKITGRRRNNNSNSNKKELSLEQQHHQIRQKGSLCAAILFWTARHRQQPRSLVQVCETVSAVVPTSGVSIQRGHCSKAMAELKEHLSTWAILVSSATYSTTTAATAIPASSARAQFNNAAAQVASVASATEHTLRKLNLPLAAEAAVRYLVLFQLHNEEHVKMPSKKSTTTPLSTRCVATAYLVCRAGSALQHLASQAQATERRSSPGVVRTSIAGSMTSQQQFQPAERNKKRKWQDEDDKSSTSNDDDDDEDEDNIGDSKNNSQEQHLFIDLFDPATVRACRNEQQVYEIQRLWDTWAEQLPWHRSWTVDMESLPGVDKTGAWTCYRDELFPVRRVLLEGLARAVATGGSNCSDNDHDFDVKGCSSATTGTNRNVVLEQERGVMRGTALATVLLTHIASAVPLIKADKK